MGCMQSLTEEDKMNRQIAKQQQAAELDNERAIHLFLVGSGDSGKSTIIKQLANLNTSKYKDPAYRKQHFANVIFSNLYDGVFALVEQEPSLVSEEEKELMVNHSAAHALPKEVAQIMIRVINASKEVIPKVPNLQDCFKVFSLQLAQNFPAWGNDSDWIPSIEDCIRARVRTTGVLKQEFEIQTHKFVLVDVGGQKAERRKWMHKFEDMNALIFVTAVSEYDNSLFEDPTKNRLADSLELFEQISNSEYLRNKPMLLFLNKRDLFSIKVKDVPLSASGIEGAPTEILPEAGAVEWISGEFQKRRTKTTGNMIVHLTCATDPENVSAVFDACKSVIFQKVLNATGL